MEHSKPKLLLESVSLEDALASGTYHLCEARKVVAGLYEQLMAGGSESITGLVIDAQEVLRHLERVAVLAYEFAPSAVDAQAWEASLLAFTNACRTEAARQLAAESAATPSEEVPF